MISEISVRDCFSRDYLPDIILHLAAFSTQSRQKRVVELRLTPDDYLVENGVKTNLNMMQKKFYSKLKY